MATIAHAETAAKAAWKIVAVTAPTHLPPEQSEVQRVTVGAEGGTFTLGREAGEGEGTPATAEGYLTYAADSTSARIESGTFEVGLNVTGTGIKPGTSIVACTPDCTTVGSTVTLSQATSRARTNQDVAILSKELTGVTGAFHVGDELSGLFLEPGTTVTAVGAGTLGISTSPTAAVAMALTATEATVPIAYDASAEALQTDLEGMAALDAGSITVTGGPGGSAASPYFVAFGGSLADQDIPLLNADEGGLTPETGYVRVSSVVPGGPGTGGIVVYPTNVGGAPTAGPVTVKVGPLPAGIVPAGEAKGEGWSCATAAGKVECVTTESAKALTQLPPVNVFVEVQSGDEPSSEVPVAVSGGDAEAVSTTAPIVVSAQPAPAGIAAFWAGAFEANGEPSVVAGGHPFSALTEFQLNTVRNASGVLTAAGEPRDIDVDLPPGFAGDPLVTARCPQQELAPIYASEFYGEDTEACNRESVIGELFSGVSLQDHENVFGIGLPTALYNDVPVFGSAVEFAAKVAVPLQALVGSVRAEEDFGIRIASPNTASTHQKLYSAFTRVEGMPPAAHGKAFLANPTDCAQQAQEGSEGRGPGTRIAMSTWQEPAVFSHAEDSLPLLAGCEALTESWLGEGPEPKEPSFEFQPTVSRGSSGTGAIASLHISQEGLTDPSKLATADLKKAVVTLPEGLALDPASANGLQACSEAQVGYLGSGFPSPNPIRFNEEAPGCPDGSKLGTVEVTSPVLEEALSGTIYLAAQEENPFHSLVALYLVIESPRFGLTVKLAGEVALDASTGQPTATFDDNPQLPVEDLTLHFRGGGPHSELATPEVCGHYATTGALTPWSAEHGEAAPISEPGFDVSSGCAGSLGARGFAPSLEAGTVSPVAGGFSPLVIKLSRDDGEQELTHLSLTLPEGLLGKLAGVGRCSDAQIAGAEASTGREQLANSSCPASSLLGSVDVAAGVGSEPMHVPGRVYLAGPYEGGPYSVVVITPAVAGPFDLGDVVVRAPLFVDKSTAQVTTRSDAIPTILDGVPLKVRSIEIDIDAPSFTLNPTSCQVMSITGSATGASGATHALASRFQVGGCEGLAFNPSFQASTSAESSRKQGASLTVHLAFPTGAQANLAKAKVQLPILLPSRLATLKEACTEEQFNANPAGCPKASVVGSATALTPILASPLTGPAYFVSHGGAKFPELVLVLQGEGITIQLDGETFIAKGITTSTFNQVPDAPVSSFTLSLPTGENSALAAPGGHLCRHRLIMPTTLTAQDGKTLQQNTRIQVQGCPKGLAVVSHRAKGKKLTLKVYTPTAGKLTVTGRGLAGTAKTSVGTEAITLMLKKRKPGALKTKVSIAFTPSSGKPRKKLQTTLRLSLR
ncbi:MAG TPA: hypothetical protein VGF95_04820 [Solirubrobacteraceae bacterium]|jgi:hypothetical protein